jgi:tetratricopeptide (TPR) repeat protein
MQEARLTLTRTRTDRETIVLKCLEKEPDRRYGSAAELAEDLERTLDSRPILARPSSTAYQLRKLVGRHRVAFGFLATVLVLLVAFSATVTIQLAIQNRERARAETAARREQRINAFFHSMLAAASPEERGRDVTVRQVLDAAAVQLDKDTVDEPAVEAALRETIGTTYRALEAIPQAEAFLREALRIRTEYLGPDHPDLGDSHLALARLYILQTRFLEAEQEADLALRVYQQLSQRRPLATARALLVRGSARTHLVRWAEAKRDLQEALRLLEDEVRVTPANEIEHAEFLETYAYLLWRQIVGWEEGERLQRRALAIRLRHLGTEHATVLTARHWLAVYVGAQDRFTEAESIFREVLAIRRRVLDPETLATGRTLQMLAETRNSLGGRLQETEALLREAMAIRRRAWGERAPNVGEDLSLLADVRAQRGSFEEAIALARQGLAIQEAYWDPVHQKTAAARCTLALVLHQAGGLDEAEALARSCVVMGDEIFGHRNDYTTLGGLALLHRILLAQGRTGEVEPILDRLGTACAPDSGAARICWAAKLSAGETLLGQGRPEEAVRTLQEGLARVRPGADGGRRRTRLLSTLADALRAAGRPAEALPHAQAAVAIQRAAPEWDMLDRAQALLALGRVQAALGARNEAAAVARELTGLVRSGKVREVSLVAGIRGLHEGP